MTEYAADFTILRSENGLRRYRFETPLMEGYTLGRNPYREFRRGVKVTTFRNDSLAETDAELTASYAIFYMDRELWEARGNVTVKRSDGKELYTQQLFWDTKVGRIYSNVDTRVVDGGGATDMTGEGFESDEEMKRWRFRRYDGRLNIEMPDRAKRDSTAPAAQPSDAAPREEKRTPSEFFRGNDPVRPRFEAESGAKREPRLLPRETGEREVRPLNQPTRLK